MSAKSGLPELWELENGIRVRFLPGHPTMGSRTGVIVPAPEESRSQGVWILDESATVPVPMYAYTRVHVVGRA